MPRGDQPRPEPVGQDDEQPDDQHYPEVRHLIFTLIDNIEGEIECVYTGRKIPGGKIPDDENMNLEHVWPQSRGAKGEAKRDMHNILASSGTRLPASIVAFAAQLGVEVSFQEYESAAHSGGALADGLADVAFLAIDPKRAERIHFTPPYVEIEGCYLVRDDSPLARNEDVDRLIAETREGVGV